MPLPATSWLVGTIIRLQQDAELGLWCYCSNTCAQSSACLCSQEVPLLALWGSCPYLTDGLQAWRSQTLLPKELFLQTRLPPGLRSLCLTKILLGSSEKGALGSQLQSGSNPTCSRQQPPSASSPGRKCQGSCSSCSSLSFPALPPSMAEVRREVGTRLCWLYACSEEKINSPAWERGHQIG